MEKLITVDDFQRAMDALNNAEMPEPLPYTFVRLGYLKALGYEGDGKPGDVLNFDGWMVQIIEDELPPS